MKTFVGGGCFVSLSLLLAAACGSTDRTVEPTRGAAGGSVKAADLPVDAAGSLAPPPSKWTGTRSCSGSAGDEELGTTSDEISIVDFSKTKTRVTIAGLEVGPIPGYSCKLDLQGAITMSDSSGSFFEQRNSVECASPTGRGLSVGELRGYDLDQREYGSQWHLNFSLQVQESQPTQQPDAGSLWFSKTLLRCEFDLDKP